MARRKRGAESSSLLGREPTWRKRLGGFWRRYQWPILLSAELVLLVLGYTGLARYYAAIGRSLSPLDLLYLTLQLIAMESGAVSGPVGWELEVARLLIPAVTAYTAVRAFATLFREQVQWVRLWFVRDQVIICGLSRKGVLLAERFREAGETVVVIERDESNSQLDLCRERGAIVLVGDATDVALLRRARARHAKWLISVCDDDGTNAEVAVHAQELARGRSRGALTCIIHIVDSQLCTLLREREIGTEKMPGFRLELFNVFDRGARALLREHPPFGEGRRAQDDPPHLLVVGVGGMGASVVVHAARDWRDVRPRADQGLRITVIDRDANGKTESLRVRFPRLDEICELASYQMDIRSPDFQRAEFLVDSEGECDVDAVYVCVDDDSLGLHAGLVLRQRMRGQGIPIVIRMAEDVGLAALLRNGDREGGGLDNLHAFGLLDRTCTTNLVLGGTHEILARALHDEYVRHQLQLGHTPETHPRAVPWSSLPESIRESNRRQVDDIGLKLEAIGYGISALTDWDAASFRFTRDQVELMAQMEHGRWSEELRARGWTLGEGPRDPARKTHPALVPWDSLPEPDKETNRRAVREQSALLARAGLQIYARG